MTGNATFMVVNVSSPYLILRFHTCSLFSLKRGIGSGVVIGVSEYGYFKGVIIALFTIFTISVFQREAVKELLNPWCSCHQHHCCCCKLVAEILKITTSPKRKKEKKAMPEHNS